MTETSREGPSSASGGGSSPGEPIHPAVPYVAMIVLALVIGVVVGIYLWFYRGEIIEILTQTPT